MYFIICRPRPCKTAAPVPYISFFRTKPNDLTDDGDDDCVHGAKGPYYFTTATNCVRLDGEREGMKIGGFSVEIFMESMLNTEGTKWWQAGILGTRCG